MYRSVLCILWNELTGYFPIFHFNPETNKFKIDSKADFSKYADFIGGEDRYRSLKNLNKDYKKILEENKQSAIDRYEYYKALEEKIDEN